MVLLPPVGWFLLWRGDYRPMSKMALGGAGAVLLVVGLLMPTPPQPSQGTALPSPQSPSPAPAAPDLPAAPPPLPHPHVSCAWLAPPMLAGRRLLGVHGTVLTNGDLFDYGPDEDGIEAQVVVDCSREVVPRGAAGIIDAGGVALYPLATRSFMGFSNSFVGEEIGYAMAFEGASAVSERPTIVGIEVRARALADLSVSARRLLRESEALAREVAAYAASRVSTQYDLEVHRGHWDELLASMRSPDGQRQWALAESHRYFSKLGGPRSRYVRRVVLSEDEPMKVVVHLNAEWGRAPAQEQQRQIAAMLSGWPRTEEVPEPNVRSGRFWHFGPYDSRPFASHVEFVDVHGTPISVPARAE